MEICFLTDGRCYLLHSPDTENAHIAPSSLFVRLYTTNSALNNPAQVSEDGPVWSW